MWKWIAASIVAMALVALGAHVLFRGSDHRHYKSMQLRAQVELVASALDQFQEDTGTLPATLTELTTPGADGLGAYLKPRGIVDPWGVPLFYRRLDASGGFVVFSLGSDGLLGGNGNALDRQAMHSGAED